MTTWCVLGPIRAAHCYSLQGNRKTLEGADHPDRDAQFQHINATAKKCLEANATVISVDTKKKELIGDYANPGRQWKPSGQPVKVQGHDFPGPQVPRVCISPKMNTHFG